MPVFDLTPERGNPIEFTSDFSATDDCTPLSVDDTSGSTGDLTVSFDGRGRPAIWKRLKGQTLQVQVTGKDPRPLGKVAHVSGGDAVISLAIDTVLNQMSVPRHALPYTGTVGGVVRYWAGLCGLQHDDVRIDAKVTAAKIAAVGFYDNVWLRLKMFTSALGIEVVAIDNVLVVRAPRSVLLTIDDNLLVSSDWDMTEDQLAHSIDITYYEPTEIVAGEMTPDYSRAGISDPTDTDDAYDYRTGSGPAKNTLPPGWLGSKGIVT